MTATEQAETTVVLPRSEARTMCSKCGVVLPFRDGHLITCPRCAPRAEVAGRIASELVEAALATRDATVTRDLLSNAEAWRSLARR